MAIIAARIIVYGDDDDDDKTAVYSNRVARLIIIKKSLGSRNDGVWCVTLKMYI